MAKNYDQFYHTGQQIVNNWPWKDNDSQNEVGMTKEDYMAFLDRIESPGANDLVDDEPQAAIDDDDVDFIGEVEKELME